MRILCWLLTFSVSLSACPLLQVTIPRANKPTLFSGANVKLGPIIPGLSQGYTPQGLCYSNALQCFFISHYKKGKPSCVSAIDSKSQKVRASFQLYESADIPHTGHVGGVSYHNGLLYLASGRQILIYELPPLSHWQLEQKLIAKQTHSVQASASFCAHAKQQFYVGSFAHYPKNPLAKRYATPSSHHHLSSSGEKNHALLLGYNNALTAPTVAFSIPDKTQGVILTDTHTYLSRSYGRTKASTLEVHQTPHSTPHVFDTTKGPIRLFVLNSNSRTRSLKLPAMSEGICLYQQHLVVLFESGASQYTVGGLGPIDRLAFYTIDSQ